MGSEKAPGACDIELRDERDGFQVQQGAQTVTARVQLLLLFCTSPLVPTGNGHQPELAKDITTHMNKISN